VRGEGRLHILVCARGIQQVAMIPWSVSEAPWTLLVVRNFFSFWVETRIGAAMFEVRHHRYTMPFAASGAGGLIQRAKRLRQRWEGQHRALHTARVGDCRV
jgi:hypothetical protein